MSDKLRNVFVTGGTGSIGAEIVRQISRRTDVQVQFSYSNNDSAASALATETGARAVKLELAGEQNLMIDSNHDVLVNSAGVIRPTGLTADVPVEMLHEALQINAIAAFQLIKAVLPHMVERQWGRIVNIGSIWAERGTDYNTPYNMSKHALLGLTRSVAKEYGKDGILCNQVDPGAVDSEIMARFASSAVEAGDVTSTREFLDAVGSRNPVGRLAQPSDVARAVEWLCFDNDFVNGVSVPVDGGLIA